MCEITKETILDADYSNVDKPEHFPNQLKKIFGNRISDIEYLKNKSKQEQKDIADLVAYSAFLAMNIKVSISADYIKEEREYILIKVCAPDILITETDTVLLSCISEIASTLKIEPYANSQVVFSIIYNL